MYMYMYIYMYMYMYMYIYVYIYVYMYLYMHIYMHIYMCMSNLVLEAEPTSPGPLTPTSATRGMRSRLRFRQVG